MSKANDPCKILIVDDDDDMREMLRRYLEREGYKVDEAKSGSAALNLIEKLSRISSTCHFDVILSDIQMRNGDGASLLRGVNQRFRPFDRPQTILLSGGSNYMKQDLVNLGAIAVLEKPVRMDTLMPFIEKSIQIKNRRKRIVAHLFVEIDAEFGRERIRKAMTLNIAAGGMCLVTGHSGFVPGTNVKFSISHGEHMLRGEGVVRWSNNIGQAHHSGIQFLPDESDELKPFENLVQEIQSEQMF